MPDPRIHDEHAWFRARLDPHALGLLDEEEERRFLEHAGTCERCAAAMKAHRENAPVGRPDAHIPPRILARWDRASRRLKGLPRRMVREHLEHCAPCRQDLEALGFEPKLAFEPGLDAPEDEPAERAPIVEVATRAEAKPISSSGHPIVVVRRPTPSARDRLGSWAVGAFAGAALATAAAILILPTLLREPAVAPSPAAGARGPDDASGAPAIREPEGRRFVMNLVPDVVMLQSPQRAAESPETHIVVRADQRLIHLALPDLYLPDTTILRVRLTSEEGGSRLDELLQYRKLVAGGTLVVGDPNLPFTPGRYSLTVTPVAGTGTPLIVFRLSVEADRAR